jgi:plastocyanin
MQKRGAIRWMAVGGSAALMGLLLSAASGCGANAASAATPASSSAPAGASGSVVHQNLTIITGRMLHKPGWPEYQPTSWSVKAGETVVLTIKSYDDGTAPLPNNSPYASVQGTVGGSELVGGHAIRSLPANLVAHTFTVPSLGINLVIPAAAKGGTVTVQATIHFTRAGTYVWRCEAPCGTGPSGWDGPMVTPGFMQGTLTVQA